MGCATSCNKADKIIESWMLSFVTFVVGFLNCQKFHNFHSDQSAGRPVDQAVSQVSLSMIKSCKGLSLVELRDQLTGKEGGQLFMSDQQIIPLVTRLHIVTSLLGYSFMEVMLPQSQARWPIELFGRVSLVAAWQSQPALKCPCRMSWGRVGIKKWSAFFCFAIPSAIFWHLIRGTLSNSHCCGMPKLTWLIISSCDEDELDVM